MNARNAVAIRISAKLVGADLILDSIKNSVIVTVGHPRNDRRQKAGGFNWRRRDGSVKRERQMQTLVLTRKMPTWNFGVSSRNARRGLGLQSTRVQGCQQHGEQANDKRETRVRHGDLRRLQALAGRRVPCRRSTGRFENSGCRGRSTGSPTKIWRARGSTNLNLPAHVLQIEIIALTLVLGLCPSRSTTMEDPLEDQSGHDMSTLAGTCREFISRCGSIFRSSPLFIRFSRLWYPHVIAFELVCIRRR